ncbi:MAG TPA: RNA methyltransferase [Vicinamibacteria bacterium]|nr:RNA methyltransferase [Vicinamibacteria bacterium]
MARVRVVLVRPEHPGNVGAAARVVRNTGLEGLDLVSPGDWRTLECWRTAWNAQDVLEQARVFETLAPALEGAALVVAFSGRRGDGVPALDVREAAAQVASLGPEEQARLVFGREASGLELDEMALCGLRAFIPSHPAQPSLNVSQAALIAGYEVMRARRPSPSATGPGKAAWEEKAHLLELWRRGLAALGALPPHDPDAQWREWTALVQRLDLTRRELHLLEHVARKMARVPAPEA